MARPRNDVSYNVADVDGIIGKYCLSKVKIFSNLFRTNKDSLKDYLSYQRNLYLLRFQVASFRQLQKRLPVSFQNPGGRRINLLVIGQLMLANLKRQGRERTALQLLVTMWDRIDFIRHHAYLAFHLK